MIKLYLHNGIHINIIVYAYMIARLTPLTKLGKLGSELVSNFVFNRVHATLLSTMLLGGRMVGPIFRVNWRFSHYCFSPNACLGIFITAPAHPYVTSVTMYPALFCIKDHVVTSYIRGTCYA